MSTYGKPPPKDADSSNLTTERARARLRESPYLSIRQVSCEFDRGALMLRGRLPTFYYKQLAQEAVADLDGIRQVVNEIEVTR